jgi:glycosyltransferase involved in cell wall biosynthesis
MKAVFAHDHRFAPTSEGVFVEDQFPASLWDRYLFHFDALTVLGRKGGIPSGKQTGDLRRSCRGEVGFTFLPNLSSPHAQIFRRREAAARAREVVGGVDAVIARLPSEIGLLAIQVARELGRPWAVEVAGCPWDGLWNYGDWQGKAYAPIMAARTRRTVARAPYALYVTREFLQRRYPNRVGKTVACSNVEIPTLNESVLERRLTRIRSGSSPFVLGLIGTLKTRYKGIQTVFKALSQVRGQLPSVEFRLLGAGDPEPWRKEAVKHGVDDLVHFDGVLPGGEPVLEWLDAVDLYLQPSLQEGLPRALVEAMSRGCPGIGSTCAGIPELLEPEALIRPGDVSSLASGIRYAVDNAQWRAEQAERNWREVGEYTTDRLNARRYAFWNDFAAYARAVQGEAQRWES